MLPALKSKGFAIESHLKYLYISNFKPTPMAVPDFQSFFKPLLDIAADGKEHTIKDAREYLAKEMQLTDEDLEERLPSGTQRTFDNRVAWAKSYFVQAKILESPRRAHFIITERGRKLHQQDHKRIEKRILNQY